MEKSEFFVKSMEMIDMSCILIGIEDLHKLELLLKQRH